MDAKVKEMNLAISKINYLYGKWQNAMSVSAVRQQILLALAAEPGISQKGIVSGYLLPKQTVSQEIRIMEKEGLLALIPDESDKRGKKIVITEKGISYTEEVLQPYFEMEKQIEKRIGNVLYCKIIDGLVAYADALEQEVSHHGGQ